MGRSWREENLDLILVPLGLLIMFSYHLFLLFRYLRFPETTVMGWENHNRRVWAERMLQLESKDRGLALTVLSSSISAATSLSSISLAMSSLIGAVIGGSSGNSLLLTSSIIYGDTRRSTLSIKYVSILACFLLAFASFVQTTRNFVHATFLISMPNSEIPTTHVEKAVVRGSNYWSVGIRALYFAAALIMWIFGPIPMFVCSVVMVGVLQNLDKNSTPLSQYQRNRSDMILHKLVRS